MPLSFAGFGLAAAGAIAGAVTGILSLDKVSEAETLCGGRLACSPETRDIVDEAEVLAHVSTASFAVAGLGAVIGVTFLALELSDDEEVALDLGPAGAALRGRF